jgi:hypothetical protein
VGGIIRVDLCCVTSVFFQKTLDDHLRQKLISKSNHHVNSDQILAVSCDSPKAVGSDAVFCSRSVEECRASIIENKSSSQRTQKHCACWCPTLQITILWFVREYALVEAQIELIMIGLLHDSRCNIECRPSKFVGNGLDRLRRHI